MYNFELDRVETLDMVDNIGRFVTQIFMIQLLSMLIDERGKIDEKFIKRVIYGVIGLVTYSYITKKIFVDKCISLQNSIASKCGISKKNARSMVEVVTRFTTFMLVVLLFDNIFDDTGNMTNNYYLKILVYGNIGIVVYYLFVKDLIMKKCLE